MSAPRCLRLFLVTVLLLIHLFVVQGATLSYSTYFGASQYDGVYAVTVDAAGNAYVAGSTASTNGFPLLNALQPVFGGGNADAFLAKFDPDGHLIFSTYFGRTGYDAINDLALDPDGNLVLVGETRSVDLLSTDDAFQYDYAGGSAFGSGDGFIAKFSPDGARLLYCSYFGGNGDDTIWSLAVDAAGNLCLEPGLFKKVTALTIKDFELLVSLGVFNSALMNDAVYKFKRCEDASLSYTGVSKHSDKDVGLFATVINSKEFGAMHVNRPMATN